MGIEVIPTDTLNVGNPLSVIHYQLFFPKKWLLIYLRAPSSINLSFSLQYLKCFYLMHTMMVVVGIKR